MEERKERGPYKTLQDFIERLPSRDMNKRVIENFIKAGALDGLPGTRKQKMMIYVQILDAINQEKKNTMAGQMTLFDLAPEEEKESFLIKLPNVGEYEKEQLLSFEKEVLGVYISGHPLEKYEAMWRKNISAVTADFMLDEETGVSRVKDGEKVVVGGMLTAKTIKHTKTGKTMAFVTLEDLVGTVEVVIFPRDYENNRNMLEEDSKVFIQGRVSTEDDRPSKLICERVQAFENVPRELWIQFADMEAFQNGEQDLHDILRTSDGRDRVVIYLKKQRAVKRLTGNWDIHIDEDLVAKIGSRFGAENVKVVEKSIEKLAQMH